MISKSVKLTKSLTISKILLEFVNVLRINKIAKMCKEIKIEESTMSPLLISLNKFSESSSYEKFEHCFLHVA